MKKEFVDKIWSVLRNNFSDKDILDNIKSVEPKNDIDDLYLYIQGRILDENINHSAREDLVVKLLSRFLVIDLFSNNLISFNKFYTELKTLLDSEGFVLAPHGDYTPSFRIQTPSEIKREKEFFANTDEEDFYWDEIVKEGRKNDIKIASQNQRLLIDFMRYSEKYLSILKNYFIDTGVDFTSNIEFIESVNKMKEIMEILSLGLGRINSNQFNIVVPFESLYSIEVDWERAIKQEKNYSFLESPIIIDNKLSFENLKKLISPYQKEISSLIVNQKSKEVKKEINTADDHAKYALGEFRKRYSEMGLTGLEYKYFLYEVENNGTRELILDEQEYRYDKKIRKEGLDILINSGLIKSFREETGVIDGLTMIAMYALCKIDEAKLVGADLKPNKHEHSMTFINSIQEKVIKIEKQNIEEGVVINKGKNKIYPPKFKEASWDKITIRFLNEQDVIITTVNENKPSNYEGLGFKNDKTNKPNTAWVFLFELSKKQGKTISLPKPIPDTIKQHKKTVSDNLKSLFRNKFDPFEVTKSNEYKILINLIPPHAEDEDPRGVKEYLTETMVSEHESDYKEQ